MASLRVPLAEHDLQHEPTARRTAGGPPFHVMACTWNVGASEPVRAMRLSTWLQPHLRDVRFKSVHVDMYVIGLQEAQPLTGVDAVRTQRARGDKWARALAEVVGKDYELLLSRQLTGIVMVILILRHHKPHISAVDVSYAATGFLNQSNKGGVAARFVIYNRAVALVVAHLAAGSGDENAEKRNADYREIVRKAVFTPSNASELRTSNNSNSAFPVEPLKQKNEDKNLRTSFTSLLASKLNASPSGSASKKVTSVIDTATTVLNDLREGGDSSAICDPNSINVLDHDLVIWMGDLNYRIDAPTNQVLDWIDQENWSILRHYDQLGAQRRKGDAFIGFEEAEINFPPTYKMVRMKQAEYGRGEDGEPKRTPSYTDRVLWRIRGKNAKHPPTVKPLDYNCAPEVLFSDHRPVFCLLSVQFGGVSSPRHHNLQRKHAIRNDDGLPTSPERASQCEINFSHDKVKFGSVPHRYCDRRFVFVENYSKNSASVVIIKQKIPPWLKVTCESANIASNQRTKLSLEVCLARDPAYRDALLDRQRFFSASVAVLVEPMLIKQTLDVSFTARNSCYAMPPSQLIIHRTPMAHVVSVDTDTTSSSSSSASDSSDQTDPMMNDLERAPQPVPKELYALVEVLARRMVGERRRNRRLLLQSRLFLDAVKPAQWLPVLDALDEGQPIDEYNDDAVATCLLKLLGALPEPLVNAEAMRLSHEAALRREASALAAAWATLPNENANVLYYVFALFAEAARSWSEDERYEVARTFANSSKLLGARGVQGPALKERVDVLLFAAEEYLTGRFEVELVTDLAGACVDPPETKKGAKKWKKKAGKRMKKVFR